MQKINKIAILCGGPSLERGISLNSARSLMDHLSSEENEIVPVYFDHKKVAYRVSPAQLYSNTPSDFDFKLDQDAKRLSEVSLVKLLRSCTIVFPAIHGAFGEDGEIQSFLEKHDIPYVGSSAQACKLAFDKYKANEFIRSKGFYTLPSIVLRIYDETHREKISTFFAAHNIRRAVVKPATGGSSIGVYSVSTVDEALERAQYLFSKRIDTRVVVEPFCVGTEFTVILLHNRFGMPVAILPTEIETDYLKHQIFDYRKKYLPTRQVVYHCPPRFSDELIEKIQYQAEQLFVALGMQDFARFDGWVLPNGDIWFSDFNPISGMEQNSFLFQQASRLGFSHRDILTYIVRRACERQGLTLIESGKQDETKRQPIQVLFGGSTSERQVSLMSGTNVWLKLRRSMRYSPTPYLLDTDGNVWKLPYTLTLNHTVEEIAEHAKNAATEEERLASLEKRSRLRLALRPGDTSEEFFLPEKMSLEQFIKQATYVFIALHGGMGENGTLQHLLEAAKIPHNGANASVSALCIDKGETGECIRGLKLPNVTTAKQQPVSLQRFAGLKPTGYKVFWQQLKQTLKSKTVIVKPIADGCSSGIVRLHDESELQIYVHALRTNLRTLPIGAFKGQATPVEMPTEQVDTLLFEEFVETDTIRVVGNTLKITDRSGWVEVTVGVLGSGDNLRALNPSLTIAEGQVLSLEEKFQGGTGINITPPSPRVISVPNLQKVKLAIEQVARAVGISGYARIDAFVERKTGHIIIIEINTLPGLTPSTVIYHQALAETPPLFPTEFLEKIITSSDGM